jgi:hypothetical protein
MDLHRKPDAAVKPHSVLVLRQWLAGKEGALFFPIVPAESP